MMMIDLMLCMYVWCSWVVCVLFVGLFVLLVGC